MAFLLRENAENVFGSLYLEEHGAVCVQHTVVGTSITSANLVRVLESVAYIADDYDDRIRARWGGHRAVDLTDGGMYDAAPQNTYVHAGWIDSSVPNPHRFVPAPGGVPGFTLDAISQLQDISNMIEAGNDDDEILAAHPTITAKDILHARQRFQETRALLYASVRSIE